MAYTTTATTTYPLLKYSRSYPTGSTTTKDWQHFTNPVLRLVLDVTKAEKSELRSVRMKVIWTIQTGGVITMNDNSEIILEDVDLLSFSTIQSRLGTPMNVPLKAVYRDTTVGIRYLHPLDVMNTAIFRRFQISLASELDTNAFIASIQGICPCKMSLLPATAVAASQRQQTVGFTNAGTPSGASAIHKSSILPAPSEESQYQLGPSSQPSVTAQQTHLGNIMTDIPQLSSMPPPPPPSQALNKTSSSLDLDAPESTGQSTAPSASPPQLTQPSHMSSQTYTAPSSSQVSTRQDNVDAEKTANQVTEQETVAHPLIAALKESTSLYDLPLDVLERAIGDIIREDGFIPLVEKLDQMWKIKSLAVKH